MRHACDMIRELLCQPVDVSDFYRGNDPVPDWIAELGRPPNPGPGGSVAADAHLARIFANRYVLPRQYQLTWLLPGSAPAPPPDLFDADFNLRQIQLPRDKEFLVSAYRWVWSGASVSPYPEPEALLAPLISQLYTPIAMAYGTSDDKVTDRPQNITALWGSRRNWAYPPRTQIYKAGSCLEFRASIDWSFALDPDGGGAGPFPETRLDVVLEGLDLYPRSTQ